MVAQLEPINPGATTSSRLARLRALTDDDEEDSDRAYRRRAIPKPAPRRKVKATKPKASVGTDAPQGSEASRSLRLKVIPPSARALEASSPTSTSVVLGLPEQSVQSAGRKKKAPAQGSKDSAPTSRKKRHVILASSSHASGSTAEVTPPVLASSTVPSIPEPLLDVIPDLSCLDLPADLSEHMGDPMILQEIENFAFDDDVMILEDEPGVAAIAEVPEPVSVRPVPRVPAVDCGIMLAPRQAPATAASEQLLAPFRDFVWKMWETFLEGRLLPEPSLEDSSAATDAQFIFAKLKEAGFDSSRMEQLVADYLGTARDLVGARESVFGQLSAEERCAEESKANDVVQGQLRKKEATASRLEEILGRLDLSRRECDRLREQLGQLEANILSYETEANAAKEDLEAESKELSLGEDELARVRALPVIDQAKESHIASLENAFFSLQKELKDLKNL